VTKTRDERLRKQDQRDVAKRQRRAVIASRRWDAALGEFLDLGMSLLEKPPKKKGT
jgi:hypothetical protein